ncbi:hypothetical protein EJ05DRAFT_104430 [Pseudovirgaria hyperparasitica]|uniref:intramembrane prenyl-peptidase Rce1 n=1 Tax=Pseudovirgaria hyperparasitica TaxID=470096 RepID=A0A6A6VYZ8_9PEZI|nr:uncharacterized protein EJ05DRAFT_104430 [Pseudovirgaria hyperparasitica]KAF2755513.1 hypothetical protein EJ05DRAFT_104430 [Pseudovirgaria hyperparasitica]
MGSPVDYLNRLVSAFRKEPEKPALSPGSAALISVLFTLIYILPFYLSPATRPSPTLSRDAPSSIRARIRAVSLSCLVASLVTIYAVQHYTYARPLDTLNLLGWWPVSLKDAAKTLLLTAILFAGPLFEAGVVEGGWRRWIRGWPLYEAVLADWVGCRNYIAGPVSEELIWRSLIIPLHLLGHITPLRTVFLTPLYFGIAHVHHYYEFRLTNPGVPALPALARSLFQFAYTSLFGFYAAFVFLRTRSLLGLILAHSFCNWMGLPRFWGRVGEDVVVVVNGERERERGRESERQGQRQSGATSRGKVQYASLGIGWTVAYYVILVAGAVGFYKQLFPLTSSERALATFE